MEKIFYKCSAYILPDISKWNVEKVKNKNDIFDSSSSTTSNYENIIDNLELLSLSSKNLSSNEKIISNEIYKINDFDFKPELNNNYDYYEEFYK